MYVKLLVIRYSVDSMKLSANLVSNIGLTTSVSSRIMGLTRSIKFMDFVKLLRLAYMPGQVTGLGDYVIITSCYINLLYFNNKLYISST